MDAPDADSPPLPNERASSPAHSQAGCVFACGVLILLLLYVGSFVLLVVAERFGFGLGEFVDERTAEFLEYFYWPLIWLYITFVGV